VLERQYKSYLRPALRMSTPTLASKEIHKKVALLKSVDRSWRHLVVKIGFGEGETGVVLRKGENKKRD
jgi:hypothetical protein